ncbi:MAG: dual specificity protein phosphatase family protein [Candidatus Hermodarchaeota archaeon]
MPDKCGFYWLEDGILAGSAYPGTCLDWLYHHQGIRAIISLERLQPQHLETAKQLGFQLVTVPIPDFTPGSLAQREQVLTAIDTFKRIVLPTLVHCQGGLGRTGMILALYLVLHKGVLPQDAISRIRTICPGSIEEGTGQEEVIRSATTE